MLVLNLNDHEPLDYSLRNTVKAVILNDQGEVLMYGSTLVGGGLEERESDDDALKREAIEEAGIDIEMQKLLGEVIMYRDFLKKKYVVKGYLCRYLRSLGLPTTTQADEQNVKGVWENPSEAMLKIAEEIEVLEKEGSKCSEGDTFQSRLFNRQATLYFLKQVFK